MKLFTSIAGLILFAGLSANACPDFSGTFVCNGEEVTVSTTVTDGISYYSFGGDAIPADGVAYNLADTDQEKNAVMTTSCSSSRQKGEFVLINYSSDYYDKNVMDGHLDLEMSIYATADGLVQDTVGAYKATNGQSPINESITCTRK